MSLPLWNARGERRVPSEKMLDEALSKLPRGKLESLCELNPSGPIYFFPTRRWVNEAVKLLRSLKVRRVVEIAAGDGFLSECLQRAAPEIEFIATDSGAWEKPQARMNAADRRRMKGKVVPGLRLGSSVHRMTARAAVRKFKPDLLLGCWLPPGPLLDSLIRMPAKYVLDIGAAGGVTASQWSWRFNHEILSGPLESLARCRLDERPSRELHSRVTLYYGHAHPEYAVERVRPGDWLWQFRPKR